MKLTNSTGGYSKEEYIEAFERAIDAAEEAQHALMCVGMHSGKVEEVLGVWNYHLDKLRKNN